MTRKKNQDGTGLLKCQKVVATWEEVKAIWGQEYGFQRTLRKGWCRKEEVETKTSHHSVHNPRGLFGYITLADSSDLTMDSSMYYVLTLSS